MKRGEIWYVKPLGTGPRPVVILSNDDYNARMSPLVADVTDVEPPPGAAYAIPLATVDPLTGWVLVHHVGRLRRQWFAEAPAGMLTGATMASINTALRDLFEL